MLTMQRKDGVIIVEDAEVRTLKLITLDELGEAPTAAVAVQADGAVGMMRVGDATVGLEELEGEAGAHGGAVGTVSARRRWHTGRAHRAVFVWVEADVPLLLLIIILKNSIPNIPSSNVGLKSNYTTLLSN
jgi:hypothetical protein